MSYQPVGSSAAGVKPHPPAELYNGPRETVDKCWGIAFLIALVSQLAIGLWISSMGFGVDALNESLCECANGDPSICVDGVSTYMGTNLAYLVNLHWAVFYGALLGIVVLLIAYAYLIKNCPNVVVWTCVIGKPVLIVMMNIWIYSQPDLDLDGSVALYTAVYLCIYAGLVYWYRESIRFSAKVLGKTGEAISAWPSIVVTGMSVNLLTILFSMWIFAVSQWLYTVGDLDMTQCVFTPAINSNTTLSTLSYIFYAISIWVLAYIDMTILYLVATGIANWYFQLTSQPMQGHPVITGLKRAVTSNGGTVAFAAIIVTIAELIKRKASRARSRRSIFTCLLGACLACVATWLEYVSRYALVLSSITGGSLMDSASTAYHTLSQFFVGGYVNDRVASLVLFGMTWALSLVVGVATWIGVEAAQGNNIFEDLGDIEFLWAWLIFLCVSLCLYNPYLGLFLFMVFGQMLTDSIGDGLTIGLFATLIAGIVFSTMGSIVLYSMSSVFTCYALDMLNGGQSPHSVDMELLMNNSAMNGKYIYRNINSDAEKGAVYAPQQPVFSTAPPMQVQYQPPAYQHQ